MVEIFQKTDRKLTRLRNRETYHVNRALNKIPTRYKKYADLNPDEKQRWKDAVARSQTKRRQSDPSYRLMLSYKSKEYRQYQNEQTKTCSKCHLEQGWCAFDLRDPKQPQTNYQHPSNTYKQTLRPECKACRKQYNKEQYELRKLNQTERV